jgi:pimeloyl-ACP methyl ester carboxylesterase
MSGQTKGARRGKIEPRFGQVLCHSRSGLHAVAYTEWGGPDAARTALCVHGLTRQGRDFDPLAAALVQRGYRVICPDLVGRGRSDWLAEPEDYGMPVYVSDMITVLARSGAGEIDWIGTSLGGLIGMQVASLAKSPIRRLVMNDIGPFLPWKALSRIGDYLRKIPKSLPSWYAAEAYFREVLAPYGSLGDAEWMHLTKYSVAHEPDGRYRLLVDPAIRRPFRPVMFYNVNLWQQWDAVRCPVLALRGEHSDLFPPEVAEEMTQRGPGAKLVEFPDCGHAPALMDYRQVATVVRWLTMPDEQAFNSPA